MNFGDKNKMGWKMSEPEAQKIVMVQCYSIAGK